MKKKLKLTLKSRKVKELDNKQLNQAVGGGQSYLDEGGGGGGGGPISGGRYSGTCQS